eukprot:g13354.t1
MVCLNIPGILSSKRSQVVRCPPDEQALTDLLFSYGVDTSSWGDGKAKPAASLLRELKEGSCSLRVEKKKRGPQRRPLKWVEPIFVQITYNGKVLVERTKIFPNGSERQHATVLAEKKWPDDASSVDAALRGMREELHVDVTKDTEGLVHSPQEDICFVERIDSASLSILLVTAFSFLNFLSLPDARAHSLLSAVLLKRRAAISGDPHSDPAFHGMNDEERIALLKAAEEALQAPLPVVQADQGHEHAAWDAQCVGCMLQTICSIAASNAADPGFVAAKSHLPPQLQGLQLLQRRVRRTWRCRQWIPCVQDPRPFSPPSLYLCSWALVEALRPSLVRAGCSLMKPWMLMSSPSVP